jgi:hypothetical protein
LGRGKEEEDFSAEKIFGWRKMGNRLHKIRTNWDETGKGMVEFYLRIERPLNLKCSEPEEPLLEHQRLQLYFFVTRRCVGGGDQQ